jgi:hypothetical protein
MWEPRRLTTLWAFTACYRDSFIFRCCCYYYYYFFCRTRNLCSRILTLMCSVNYFLCFKVFCDVTPYSPTSRGQNSSRSLPWEPQIHHACIFNLLLKFLLFVTVLECKPWHTTSRYVGLCPAPVLLLCDVCFSTSLTRLTLSAQICKKLAALLRLKRPHVARAGMSRAEQGEIVWRPKCIMWGMRI